MTLFQLFRHYVADENPVVLATVIAGPRDVGTKILLHPDGSYEGTLQSSALIEHLIADGQRLLLAEQSDTIVYDLSDGRYEVFIDAYPAPPQLLIVGAGHIAIPLSRMGKMLGYRVIVTDARAAFAAPERLPDADQVIKGWPQDVLPELHLNESTYVVLLSHDAKFDEPTLREVLPSRVRYIGAIGSRRTQESRFARLREEGHSEEQLARVYGPVGLDLGARTAEETALAIMAEVTAVRRGKQGGFMGRRETSASR